MPEVMKLWGAPPGGADGPHVGRELIVWGIYMFSMKYECKVKYTFWQTFAWLKYFTYQLVPVLAPNYKQHILSPAEVIKVCYSLA
jgi:hypothetical protein